MTAIEKCFLEAYSHSLLKEHFKKLISDDIQLSPKELRQLFKLAEDHMVFPMVFETIFTSSDFNSEDVFMQRLLEKAVKITNDQARRTAEFLKLLQFLSVHGLSPIVVKGIICRSLYPQPEKRPSTDEDLLVSESQFEQYHRAFLEYGLELVHKDTDIGSEHEVSYCGRNLYIEVHKTLFPPESQIYGNLNRFFEDVDLRKASIDIYGVPVTCMDPTDHVLYQICHAYKHFLNCGIGIRIVSDIVLYSMHYEDCIDWENVKDHCREINALSFISAVYRIGEKYLFAGRFPGSLSTAWDTATVDEQPLLNDILAGGIYGTSTEERLHSANITLGAAESAKTGDTLSIVKRTAFPSAASLRNRYPYLNGKPFLLPIAWMQRTVSFLSESLFRKRNVSGISEAVRIGNERVAIMRRYSMLSARNNNSLLRRIYRHSQTSAIAPFLGLVYRAICSLEYEALTMKWYFRGDRRPSKAEQELVKENVTFIAKSFERKRMAKGLCRNINRMYPGARVIIADDSRIPLKIDKKNVSVISMPYNSGIGAGLKAALEQVGTPYVMRLDDDELLTIRSKVHTELQYLMRHDELDLIGFGHVTAIRLRSPQTNFKEYYQSPMNDAPLKLKIPHLTRLDENHVVLGKVANIYLARTDKLKEVGYDPEIRVIDHHDFFRRAAGVITSAVALDTVVFHRHDPYNRNYNLHRSDYQGDIAYIKRKTSIMLREK